MARDQSDHHGEKPEPRGLADGGGGERSADDEPAEHEQPTAEEIEPTERPSRRVRKRVPALAVAGGRLGSRALGHSSDRLIASIT